MAKINSYNLIKLKKAKRIITEDVISRHLINKRISYAMIFIFIIWLFVVLRLWHLQIGSGSFYESLAQKNYLRSSYIPAPRGNILDRNNKLILGNRTFFDLVMIRPFARDKKASFKLLENIINIPSSKLTKNYEINKNLPNYLPITLYKNLSLHQVSKVQAMKILLPGIEVATEIRRQYEDVPESTAHILGYLSSVRKNQLNDLKKNYPNLDYIANDFVGQYGLEKTYEPYLRGKKGSKYIRVDALGRRIDSLYDLELSELSLVSATPGSSIVTTIDLDLQKITQDAFAKKIGAVVVINAKTGEILAMVSSPSYPLDMYQSDISQKKWQKLLSNPHNPLLDKTTGAQFQPGSTIKVIIALAALQKGLIDHNSYYNCPGYWQFGDKTYHCHKHKGHGAKVTLKKAIAQSCNVFFYNLAVSLGIKNIHQYLQMFSLGKRLGLNLNEEKTGLIPSNSWKMQKHKEPWYEGETPIVAIGQGPILVTPLQLASTYAAIGNNGSLFKPRIIKSIINYNGIKTHDFKSVEIFKIKKNMIDPKYFDLIDDALVHTVNDEMATARLAQVDGVSVAGKTGSVQLAQIKRGKDQASLISNKDNSANLREHAIFAAYSPAEDAQIAIAVISQNDAYGGGGAQAAPIAQKIIKAYFDLKKSREYELSKNTQKFKNIKKTSF